MLGCDMIAIAKTGSGKTFSFLIPCLMKIEKLKRMSILQNNFHANFLMAPLALILAPTRELAIQIYQASKMMASLSHTKVCVVYGGADRDRQISEMSKGVDLLIATPGRLIDFLQAGKVRLNSISFFVLDEADRMLVSIRLLLSIDFPV
jgi:superfamily II DNA/RNA helicase